MPHTPHTPDAIDLGSHSLRWEVTPEAWSWQDGTLTVDAAARTDVFVSPLGWGTMDNAARAMAEPPDGDWQFTARLRVGFRDSWDAGALLVHADAEHWAKLNLERSPEGVPTVYSVVTRGRSDDAVGWGVDGDHLWLRVSSLDGGYVFHASADGRTWRLVRQFDLDAPCPVRVGVEAQSPVGDGCRVLFDGLSLAPTRLAHLFDGR